MTLIKSIITIIIIIIQILEVIHVKQLAVFITGLAALSEDTSMVAAAVATSVSHVASLLELMWTIFFSNT